MNIDWQSIEKNLNEKLKSSFENITNFQFEESVKIFLNVIRKGQMNSLFEALQIRYVDNDFGKFEAARKEIATSIETYFKTIFAFTDANNTFEGTLSPCFNKFFDDVNPLFLEDERSKFTTSQKKPNPKEDLEYFASRINFGDKFKLIYDLRNSITHSNKEIIYPSYTKILSDEGNFVKDIQDCVIVYIYVAGHYSESLKKYFSTQQEYNFNDYLQNLKENFREKISRFVHLKGKEDIQLSNTYVIEQKEDTEEEEQQGILERRGTVDELRKNKIPEKRMMLWGDAGMGKTTTLEYMAYQDAENCLSNSNENIPVYISLGLMTDKNISIKNNIFNKLGIDEGIGEVLLKQGKINLFLDAINEIPQDDNNQLRTYRQREIENLLSNYPKTFIIISNRPQDTNIFINVPVFLLQKMDDTQIELFLKRNAQNSKVKQKIKTAISKDERLKSIIKTPFMLSRLIEVVNRLGEVPTNKGDIIHEFIQSLYKREKIEKKDANFNLKVIHRLLRSLGFESLEQKGTNAGLTEDEVLNIFAKRKNEFGFQIDTVYVLEIATQLGILEEQEEIYVFAHQEYQDYYHFEEEKAILEGI